MDYQMLRRSMIIEHRVSALRHMLESVDLEDRTQTLLLFTSAYTIWKSLDAEIAALEGEDRPVKTNYVLEKLARFISHFHDAAIPYPGDERHPQYWLKEAGFNLTKVEMDVKDFE